MRKKLSKLKIGIIVSSIVVLLAGAGVGTYFGITELGNNDTHDASDKILFNISTEIDDSQNSRTILTVGKGAISLDILKANKDELTKTVGTLTIDEIRLPHSLRDEIIDSNGENNSTLVQESTGLTIDKDNINFIVYKSEYVETRDYQKNSIVEVKFPENITEIKAQQFKDNKIKKVNFEELNKVESVWQEVFANNKLKNIDFSKMTSLKTLGEKAFTNNEISGTLKIPSQVLWINEEVFKGNQIEKLDLSVAKELSSIGNSAFEDNNIETIIPQSKSNIQKIDKGAFKKNHIIDASFVASIDSLKTIGEEAFSNQTSKDDTKTNPNIVNTLTSSIGFSHTLTTIGTNAFKAKDGITINVSSNGRNGINSTSFGHSNLDNLTLSYSVTA